MADLLVEALEYCGGQLSNLTREDESACGQTDDLREEEPKQLECIAAGSTKARNMANALFGAGKVRLPIETVALGDMYDFTQSYTRINDIYAMTRESYYAQGSANVTIRKNRISRKQSYASKFIRTAKEVKELLGVPEENAQ